MTIRLHRTLSPLVALAAVLTIGGGAVQAQVPGQGQAQVQSQAPVCSQLEAQLAAFDRGGGDPAQAERIRRYEEVIRRQQAEMDRARSQSRNLGCESRGFFLFSGRQPEQCGPLTRRIQEQRANLDQVRSDLERLRAQSSGPGNDAQRRGIIAELSRNNCGEQYQREATAPRGLFDALFGDRRVLQPSSPEMAPSGTYRTVCVRTCDGFYFPISFSTTPARFQQDQATCQQQCPAAQAVLYSYPNGADINSATSINGEPYTALPNAFRYRKALDPSCGCRQPGQSWADALSHSDGGAQQGDIIVTEPMGRRLSQPRFDADGKPIQPEAQAKTGTEPKTQPNTVQGSAEPDPNRTVRSVGPAFYSNR